MGIDGLKSLYFRGSNFKFCVNIAEKPLSLTENLNQRWKTSYFYALYGTGKVYDESNPSNFQDLYSKEIIDVERFNECEVVRYEAFEPSHIIGFNPDNKEDRWEAELLDNSLKSLKVDHQSVIICFNGSLTINGKEFTQYNFAQIQPYKEYSLIINENAEVGLFKFIL